MKQIHKNKKWELKNAKKEKRKDAGSR
jgi:hypothetical protein